MQLKSQEMRKLAPELDPLRIGGRCRDSDAQLSETYEYGTCPDGLSDLRRAGRDI